ncbi:MAG: HDIG domain-containing protein [Phormidium sp. BM_Day4_Bin.17]|nr:HDIG domain-containing protein [Phormidium sp. BM_Day4_Bin.17]UCJ11593.1 MAG: HDIG domain-containing protein [Phormidium sp. PBR-2020]
MKTLQFLTRRIERKWHHWRDGRTPGHPMELNPAGDAAGTEGSTAQLGKPPRKLNLSGPVSTVVAVFCLTGALGQRFYNQPKLDVGSRAPQTLLAPRSDQVEDRKTTEERRRSARLGTSPVLMGDPVINQRVLSQVKRYLEQGNRLREELGDFPYVETAILSQEVQRYLRNASNWEWRAIQWTLSQRLEERQALAAETPVAVLDELSSLAEVEPETIENRREQILQATRLGAVSGASQVLSNLLQTQTSPMNQSIEQLLAASQRLDEEEFEGVVSAIEAARERYAQALEQLSAVSYSNGRPVYTNTLLNLSAEDWQKTRNTTLQIGRQMLSQGIAPGVPPTMLQDSVEMQLSLALPDAQIRHLMSALLMNALEPNLVTDPDRTRERAELAAQAQEAVYISVEAGEVIVEANEVITQRQFVLLDHFDLVRRDPVNWFGWIAFGGTVFVAVSLYGVVERRVHPKICNGDRLLILLLTLSAPVMVLLGSATTSFPAIGLAVGSFYGSWMGVTVVALLSLIMPIGLEIELGYLVAGAISGALGGAIAGRLRSREELALLGVGVGLAQGLTFLLLTVIGLLLQGSTGPLWSLLLETALIQGLWGVAWSIVVLGISPYLEHLFDLVTPIRLAELSNPNRPLLKRLAAEAPGTFQHTLFVATLAESAAKALGCNVELVRAGTLYHDIGKMHDPQGFVENQMGGPNKHDRINDPWKSAAIIKKHVTQGLVMARKSRLPKAIQAFIPEHQGTMLIAYFYYQAKHSNSREVNDADFRYDGPIPQSRETGIVMLADSCEAALRSLKDATPDDALSMVNKILRARWQDNQLVDSGLTRAEMGKIAEIFVQVWQQFNHKRIAYPKAVLSNK